MANRRSIRQSPIFSRRALEVILILIAGVLMGFLENYRLGAAEPLASAANNLEGVLIWLVFLAPLVLSAIEKRPGLGFVLGTVLGVFVKRKGNHLIIEKGTTFDVGPAP